MHSDRIFQGESTFPDHEEWFYRTREGVAGPYLSRDDAALALRRFIKYCQENRLDGGRAARVQRGSRKIANRMAKKGLSSTGPVLDWNHIADPGASLDHRNSVTASAESRSSRPTTRCCCWRTRCGWRSPPRTFWR